MVGGWRMLCGEEHHDLKEVELGGACSTHGKYEKCISLFSWKTLREETTRKT
jgi:hypothetical protein